MKTIVTVASATLLVLCCVYFVRLNDQAARLNAGMTSTGIPEISGVSSDVSLPTPRFDIRPQEKYDGLQTTKTRIAIFPGEQKIVYGRKGTGLLFPPNAFADANGNVVKGRVDVLLEECYDIPEMLAAKLSTTSDKRILETAGMVNISARAGGSEVFLREGVAYNIYFPKKEQKKDDFNLFYGEWTDNGVINWRLAEASAEEARMSSVVSSEDNTLTRDSDQQGTDDCFIQICESYLRRGTRISEMDYFNWKLNNGQTLNQWFVAGFNPDLKMLEDFCGEGMRSRISFKVDRDGNFLSYYVANSSEITEYDRVFASFLQQMPALDLGQLMPVYTDDHECILTFGTKENEQQDDFVKNFRRRFKGNEEKPLTNVNSSELDYFVFASSELGWINCDRFTEDEGLLVDFEVTGSVSPDATVSMVFEDMNSVLKGVREGDRVLFEGVPRGRKVRIIGLENRKSDPVMCVTRANTSDKKVKLTSFNPVTLPALEAEFARR